MRALVSRETLLAAVLLACSGAAVADEYFGPPLAGQVGGFTGGSVPFANAGGFLTQDNANLFWDDVNKSLGIGTTSPIAQLDIRQSGAGAPNPVTVPTAAQRLLLVTKAGAYQTGGEFAFGILNTDYSTDPADALQIYQDDDGGVNFDIGGGAVTNWTPGWEMYANPVTGITQFYTDGGFEVFSGPMLGGVPNKAFWTDINSDGHFYGDLTLGTAGSVLGTLAISGNTSGTITIKPQAAAGTFNFNLPTTAGSSGDFLTSGGGGSTAMSWTSPSSLRTTLQGNGLTASDSGFRGIPQNSQSSNYTTVAADAGKMILHPSGGGAGDTVTIDSNANVAYSVGTCITFINADSNSWSVAIASDTLTLAGTTTTGTRTLAQNAVATACKVSSTVWIISGAGVS